MSTLYIQYPAASGGGGGGLTISIVTTPLLYDVPTQTLSIQQSSTLLDGYLSAVNFNIFNNKQPAGSYITALTGDVTATGPGSVAATIANLAVTNAKIANATIDLTTKVTGVLPIANGGTNSATVLSNNRVMQSLGGSIVEAAAITAARALISDVNGIPTHSVTTAAELAFVNGVTSNIQTQLNAKEPTITVLPIAKGGTNSSAALNNNRIIISSGGAIVEDAAITANRALASNASGIPVASATTDTELGFVAGVTSAIQTQLNNKQATGNYITALTGDVTATGPGSVAATIANDAVTTVKILNANVTSAKIAAAAVSLTTQVSGVLPEANGGTNQSTYTTGDTLYASAANTLSKRTIGTAGQVLTVAGGVPTWATPSASSGSGTTNTIINGDMSIRQRIGQVTLVNGVGGSGYVADRMQILATSSVAADTIFTEINDAATAQNTRAMRIRGLGTVASPASGDLVNMVYNVEGSDLLPLAGQQMTLSFYVKSTQTGVFSVSFINGASDRSYVQEVTINATNTWERKTVTLTHDTTGTWGYNINELGMKICFNLMSGSSFQGTNAVWQAGNIHGTAASTFNLQVSGTNDVIITQIMLEQAATASTIFKRCGNSLEEEVALCQRYYEKSYPLQTDPGSANNSGNMAYSVISVTVGSVTIRPDIRFKANKRGTPGVVIYSTDGTANAVRINNSGNVASASENPGEHGTSLTFANTWAVQDFIWWHYTADAEF